MKKDKIRINNIDYPVYSVNSLVVGTGAAGLNAALQLYESGVTDLVIATEKLGAGTSNNAGSDKQTYYKLSLDSRTVDSPFKMAQDLFNGGSMHGDIALCEAQYSMPSFYNLVRLGVPFPHDDYGAFPGYITDHDPLGRGTSAGPLTSKFMFSALLKAVRKADIPVLDTFHVIALLASPGDNGQKSVRGAIAIDGSRVNSETNGLVFINSTNILLASGGPGALYKYSVYPQSQTGSIGMALRIGAKAQNLTESQFGIASIVHRWNLSGTYQQAIPRYYSTDLNGNDQKEFLNEFFPDLNKLCSAIFLKGYQWPFDPRKIVDFGSSLIDLLVYNEIAHRGRRVFLDYKHNPGDHSSEAFSIDDLSEEASSYLKNSGAVHDLPIERLAHMNQPAIDLFMSHGINLREDPLEIAVCAQHNNGGLQGNIWWESNIKNLFPIGEINGTHGVYRPGGSALNAGQVGGMRAAQYIALHNSQEPPDVERFFSDNSEQVLKELALCQSFQNGSSYSPEEIILAIQTRMSDQAAHIRNPNQIESAIKDAWQLVHSLPDQIRIDRGVQITDAYKAYDLALTHAVYLESIYEYIRKGGGSRGSYLVVDPEGLVVHESLDPEWRIKMGSDAETENMIQEIYIDPDFTCHKNWVEPRPIPIEKHWFETLWKQYRDNKSIT